MLLEVPSSKSPRGEIRDKFRSGDQEKKVKVGSERGGLAFYAS